MRVHRVLCLGLAMAVPQLALAELSVSNAGLGQVEGILHFCAKADPASIKSDAAQSKLLTGKASPKELTDARSSSEYLEAYSAINAELEAVEKARAAQVCADLVAGK
jgi:hypothetical protein